MDPTLVMVETRQAQYNLGKTRKIPAWMVEMGITFLKNGRELGDGQISTRGSA